MSHGKLPFFTRNRTLAIALHLGGAHILGYWRTYTPDEVKHLGMPLAEAARRDIGGQDAFFIEDGELRQKLCAAFDETALALKQNDPSAPIDLPSVSAEDSTRIACMTMKLRSEIANLRRDPDRAKLMQQNQGEPHAEWERDKSGQVIISGTVTHPGFSLKSATAL